jgi:hypothetical protein
MPSAAIESALNRPVWSALTTGDRGFAQGGPLALRFPPDIAPSGATADDSPEAYAALKELLSREGRVALVGLDNLKPYPGLEVVREAPILQMIADGETPSLSEGQRPIVLGASDVPEMLRLAGRARMSSANILACGSAARSLAWLASEWAGVRLLRLRSARSASAPSTAAKATPRFSWPRSSASSARSEEGVAPFPHVFTDNPAIALYERLGFTKRKTLRLTVLARGSD